MWHCETSAQLRQNASCIIIWIESHMIHNTARAPRFAYMIQIFIQTGGPGVRIMYVLHCTTYYRHVRFTPFNIAVPWATNYMVPDPAEEFSKQGARAPNTTLPVYHDCIWFRHWQCQMPQMQTGEVQVWVSISNIVFMSESLTYLWCLTHWANKGQLARVEGTKYNITRVSWLHMIQTLTVSDVSNANRGVQVWECTGPQHVGRGVIINM